MPVDSEPDIVVERGSEVRRHPRVSVIVPAWFRNPQPGGAWLDEALESVRAQTFRDWELIIVDDGSPAPVTPSRTDDLVLVRQPNAGPGGARNSAVRLAQGEFLAFLDADDRWLPDKLARQVAFLDANPDVVLTCTDILLTDGTPMKTAREKRVAVGDRIPFEFLFHENCVGCSTVVMRRATFEMTRGMDSHRRMGEDFALWLRVGLLGAIGYLEAPLMVRRRHADSLMSDQMHDGSWWQREREVYDEFLAEAPHLRSEPFVARAQARLAFQRAWMRLAERRWAEARKLFLASARHDPLRWRTWVNLARAILHIGPRRQST